MRSTKTQGGTGASYTTDPFGTSISDSKERATWAETTISGLTTERQHEALQKALCTLAPHLQEYYHRIAPGLLASRISMMAINAFCSDSELLLPQCAALRSEESEQITTFQEMCRMFRDSREIYPALVTVTALKLWSELFPEGIQSIKAQGTIFDHYPTEQDVNVDTNPANSWERFSLGQDTDRVRISDVKLQGDVFTELGEPLLQLEYKSNANGGLGSLVMQWGQQRRTFISNGEIVVPGAGLNGLRILAALDAYNVAAEDARRDYEGSIYDIERTERCETRIRVIINDKNPFVCDVYQRITELCELPEGAAEACFISEDLSSGKLHETINAPTAVLLSQVQSAGPDALAIFLRNVASTHRNSGQPQHLTVLLGMQDARMEAHDAVASDLTPILKQEGFEQRVALVESGVRKSCMQGDREKQFWELSPEEYTKLSQDSNDLAQQVPLVIQLWELPGTAPQKTVWVRDPKSGLS